MRPAYRYDGLGVMTAVYTLNLTDRGLLALALQPIKQDLQLSDTQLGLLSGIAFALFYATLGVPIARWADRGNRVGITALAIALWGVTIMAMVWVTSFAQLLAARVAAAIGEAGCKPPTYALVGDYFPKPQERTRALAIYNIGNTLSAVIAFIIGGWLIERYGWRDAFLIMGVPGLALSVLVALTLREPRRAGPVEVRAPPSFKFVATLLWRSRSLRHITIALILLYVMTQGLNPWYAAFMARSHGMGSAAVGLWLGAIISIVGTVGILAGAVVANRWFAGNEAGQMRLAAGAVSMIAPCLGVFLIAGDTTVALGALIPLYLVYGSFVGPTYALMQRLTPPNCRATVLAIVMLLANLIGMGAGPLIVGILSDLLRPRFLDDSLRYAMLAISLTAFWAAFHFHAAARTLNGELNGPDAQPR